jgi:putative endonuclease
VSREPSRFGRAGESAAERYLRRKGYRILARNVRSFWGELDLVAEHGRVLVFIEVKARRTSMCGGAPFAVDPRKQARVIRLAAQYLADHRVTPRSCRFDVVLCTGGSSAPAEIEHIENAFEVPGHQLQW